MERVQKAKEELKKTMQTTTINWTPKSKKGNIISMLRYSPERGADNPLVQKSGLFISSFSTKNKGGSLNFDLNFTQTPSICKSLFQNPNNRFGEIAVLDPSCIFQASEKEIRNQILNVLAKYKCIILNRVS